MFTCFKFPEKTAMQHDPSLLSSKSGDLYGESGLMDGRETGFLQSLSRI